MGVDRALVVHGCGLDEVALHGPTRAIRIGGNDSEELELTPEQAGLERVPLRAVQGGDVAENAARFRALLDGKAPEADEQIVLLNCAALLLAAGKAGDLREGVEQAREALRSGKAASVLQRYLEASK